MATKAKEDTKPDVHELAQSAVPRNMGVSFSEWDEAQNKDAPFAVEGNDLSGFTGVSPEYRTYASEVDSPLDFDPAVADNSDEKAAALADSSSSSDSGDSSADTSGSGS